VILEATGQPCIRGRTGVLDPPTGLLDHTYAGHGPGAAAFLGDR
jgi:hypothetical protein